MTIKQDWEVVRKWMYNKTVVPAEISVKKVAEILVAKNIGSVIVSKEGKECGIITERDILRKIVSQGFDCSKTTAAQVMTCPLQSISDDKTIWEATFFMATHNIRRLPVTNFKGDIVGIVTTRTISNALPVISKMELSTRLRSTLNHMTQERVRL